MNIQPTTPHNQTIPQISLSEDSKDLLQRLKKLNSSFFFNSDKVVNNKLKSIKPADLNNILQSLFMDMIKEGHPEEALKAINRLSSILPLEKLQESVKDDMQDALKQAKNMFQEAKLYLEAKENKTSPSLRTHLSSIIDTILNLIDSIISAFGIADFLKASDSEMHADFKSQKIMMLLSIFSMITTVVLPLLGAATGGLIIGGILLSISAISLIWRFIRPMPTKLPANGENWTKQVQNKNFIAQGRKESLDEIANTLKMNRHALLVGPSRVGKSLTAKAFAQAIERGDYPELKGMTVFRINTADLIGQKASFLGGGNTILYQIRDAMGRHRKKIILVLDEIHMACKNGDKISDQLKLFLDEGGDFPHVIGITTNEEYYKHIKGSNNAFSNRFNRIDIRNTSQDETLKILGETLLKTPSNPLIEVNTLEQIYQNSSSIELNTPQPIASINLLKKCIVRTEKNQKSSTEEKITAISNRIASLRSQSSATRGKKKDYTEINELEKLLAELQNTLKAEHKELQKLHKTKTLFDQVTIETYTSILKIASISKKILSSSEEKELKRFILLHRFLSRSFEDHIKNRSNELGVKLVIDKNLILEAVKG